MENNWETRQTLFYFFQNVKAELWLLTRLKLVCAVAGTDCDCQRVYTGTLYEILNLCRIGVGSILCANVYIVLNACQSAQLAFYYGAVCVGILYNFLGQSNIVLIIVVRTVNHNGGETTVYAVLAQLKGIAMIQVQCHRNFRMLNHCSLYQLYQISMVCILSCASGYLQNNRSLVLCTSLCNPLYDLHVVYVKCADCVTALICLFKHFCCCYQCHYVITLL